MFLRAMCFFFSSIFKNKKGKKTWPKKKIHPDKKKNGNDFGDEIKECLFVILRGENRGGTTRIDKHLN